jgi:hypothetical protein
MMNDNLDFYIEKEMNLDHKLAIECTDWYICGELAPK